MATDKKGNKGTGYFRGNIVLSLSAEKGGYFDEPYRVKERFV
jgi:hypothetical protein